MHKDIYKPESYYHLDEMPQPYKCYDCGYVSSKLEEAAYRLGKITKKLYSQDRYTQSQVMDDFKELSDALDVDFSAEFFSVAEVMEPDCWFDKMYFDCSRCEKDEVNYQEAQYRLKLVLRDLYNKENFDLIDLEHDLDDLCHCLNVHLQKGQIKLDMQTA